VWRDLQHTSSWNGALGDVRKAVRAGTNTNEHEECVFGYAETARHALGEGAK
jgi:hypothetical protein